MSQQQLANLGRNMWAESTTVKRNGMENMHGYMQFIKRYYPSLYDTWISDWGASMNDALTVDNPFERKTRNPIPKYDRFETSLFPSHHFIRR